MKTSGQHRLVQPHHHHLGHRHHHHPHQDQPPVIDGDQVESEEQQQQSPRQLEGRVRKDVGCTRSLTSVIKKMTKGKFARDVAKLALVDEVKMIWRLADAVSFDVDSTVIQEEGIDELAKFCGKGEQVANLTKQAMQGNMTFQQSLAVRLNIIQPSQTQIKEFIRRHPPKLTAGIKSLVDALQAQQKDVYLISGGFHSLIAPVAAQLNIPPENVYANRLKFFFNGEYAGFDETEPTSKTGGKGEVIRRLKEDKSYKNIVHIGDGATDMEACPPANAFIGFGGNVVRESVKSHSPWFIMDFKELITAL